MNYSLNFDFLAERWPDLLEGLWVTIELTVAANFIGITLGFVICLAAMSHWWWLRLPVRGFIEFFRCTPALLQIIWIFYCVPIMFDVFIDPIPMGILALGLNLAAFNAEAYRAGAQAVPKEHFDACVALGLRRWQQILFVVLPQAARNATPVLITNGIGILQQSALVAIVSVADLMYMGKSIATENYRVIETYSVVAVLYLLLSLPIAKLATAIERRHDRATERTS